MSFPASSLFSFCTARWVSAPPGSDRANAQLQNAAATLVNATNIGSNPYDVSCFTSPVAIITAIPAIIANVAYPNINRNLSPEFIRPSS
jgi:hypothetical protein